MCNLINTHTHIRSGYIIRLNIRKDVIRTSKYEILINSLYEAGTLYD